MTEEAIIDDLILEWSNGTISEAQTANLETLLKNNQHARLKFARTCMDDVALIQNLQIEANATPSSDSHILTLPKKRRRATRRPAHSTRKKTTSNSFLWITLGLAALLFIGIALNSTIHNSTQNLNTHASLNQAFAAHVINGELFQGDSPVNSIAFNQTVQTKSHFCKITFHTIGATMEIHPESTFHIQKDGHVFLNGAQVSLTVDPLPAGTQLTVHGRYTFAHVVGTQFEVIDSQTHTQVTVREGTVRCQNADKQDVFLSAGQSIDVHEKAPRLVGENVATNAFSPYVLTLIEKNKQEIIRDTSITMNADTAFSILISIPDSKKISSINGSIDGENVSHSGIRNSDGLFLEQVAPFHLFGDDKEIPRLQPLNVGAGVHDLKIKLFADDLGEQLAEELSLQIIVNK